MIKPASLSQICSLFAQVAISYAIILILLGNDCFNFKKKPRANQTFLAARGNKSTMVMDKHMVTETKDLNIFFCSLRPFRKLFPLYSPVFQLRIFFYPMRSHRSIVYNSHSLVRTSGICNH